MCFALIAACIGTVFSSRAETIDLNGVPRTLTSADDFTSATTYTNSGETVVGLTITVDEGERITADAVIAGNIRLVKAGMGRLQLNAANTYTGGTLWQAGYLEANNTSAFGAAKTTVTCTTSSTGIHSGDLWFYLLKDGDYDYTFDFQNSNVVLWSIASGVNVLGDITDSTGAAKGKIWMISALGPVTMQGYNRPNASLGIGARDMSFNGNVTAKDLDAMTCYRRSDWRTLPITEGSVTCSTYDEWKSKAVTTTRSYGGTTVFKGDHNTFDFYDANYENISVTKANSLSESMYFNWATTCWNDSSLLLNGADQTINYLSGSVMSEAYNKNYRLVNSADPATLTLKATKSASTCARLDGKVSLVYDATNGGYTQSFISNRVHQTSGTLTAKNGTLELGGGTTWMNLTGLAALNCATVLVTTTAATPFDATKLNVTVAGSGKIKTDRDLTVRTAIVDGTPVEPATYNAGNCSWIAGDGSVTVTYFELRLTSADNLSAAKTYENTAATTLDLRIFADTTEKLVVDSRIIGNIRVIKEGNGRLRLNADNTYTGGTLWKAGYLEAGTLTAFGAAGSTVTCQTSGSSDRFFHLLAKGDYDYTFDFQNSNTIYWQTYDGVNVKGPIVDSTEKATGLLCFLGSGTKTYTSVNRPKAVLGYGASTMYMTNAVVVKAIKTETYWGKPDWINKTYEEWQAAGNETRSNAGTLYLKAADNSFGYYYGYHAGLAFSAPGGIPESAYFEWPAAAYGNCGIELCGVDQTANYLLGPTSNNGDTLRLITSAEPATLTLKATKSASACARLDGQVSLVYDAKDATYTQSFVGVRNHLTTGTLTAKNGTLELGGATTWKKLSGIVALDGATVLVSTTGADALSGLKEVRVAAGGTFKVTATTSPFGDSVTTLFVDDDTARVELPEGTTLKLGGLCTNGVYLADGDYTPTWLQGSNVKITVKNKNMWVGPKDGAWGTAANWAVGVPSASQAGYVHAGGASDVSAVVGAAASVGELEIMTKGTGTATVKVQAPMTLATDKVVTIGDKGELSVEGEDGLISVTGATVKYPIKAGGTLTLGSEGTNVVRTATQSDMGGLVVEAGGTLNVTNGALRVGYTTGTRNRYDVLQQRGGTINFSGDAALLTDFGTFTGCDSAFYIFGTGKTTFSDNATWSVAPGTRTQHGPNFVANAAGETCEIEFVDNACIPPLANWNTFGNMFIIGGCAGATTKLTFDSTGTSRLGYSTYVGDGAVGDFGRGELYVKKGKVFVSSTGLRVGFGYEKFNNTHYSDGYVEVSGGELAVQTYGYKESVYNVPNGLAVGVGSAISSNKNGKVYLDSKWRGTVKVTGGKLSTDNADTGFAVGLGLGEGHIVQTGGEILRRTSYWPAVVGFVGGRGDWTMSGGTATVETALYVGGVTTNEYGEFFRANGSIANNNVRIFPADWNDAKGTLKLDGGTMTVASNLVFSAHGVGTLELGTNANLVVNGKLDARDGSKLRVDVTGYQGRSRTLATFVGGTTNAFDEVNIERIGETTSCRVVVNPERIRVQRVSGLVVIFR